MHQKCTACDGGRIKFSLGGFKKSCSVCKGTGFSVLPDASNEAMILEKRAPLITDSSRKRRLKSQIDSNQILNKETD